jgi:hypothetical protein
MPWKDWALALALTLLAVTNARLLVEYRRTRSGAVLLGVVGTLVVAGLLMLARFLPD